MTTDRDERLLRRLQRQWLNGGSALPLMQFHVERNEVDDATIVGRAALAMEECRDADAIEELLSLLESTPDGWDAAIERFVHEPSKGLWDKIVRFAPQEL